MSSPTVLASTIIDASFVDYLMIFLYFAVVLGIGILARRQISDSLDFFLSGRSLPAWVTGLAFISANLGAVEIMGMSANGAQFGVPTVHYFWIGAIPAMLFLGVVMMPFYYGSKVRSVPEFMFRRFGTGAHLVNAISFAVAQLLIAGINLFLLASIVHALLGWPQWLALIVAAVVVLSYITLGGLSAAIYNEVLQFFVIVAALLPLTLIGLHRVGGWDGVKNGITSAAAANPDTIAPADQQLNSWAGNALTGFTSDFWSVVGIVFGLGFVLSFGYWTTNFVEVQRAMASDSISSARKTPIIGAFPKMFVPFITILPGMIAAVLVHEIADVKAGETVAGGSSGDGVTYNDSLLYLMRDILPNGLLGVAIAGLLAAFMAGMAANVSAFNTVLELRPLAALRRQGQERRVLPAGRPDRNVRRRGHRDLHRDPGVELHEHHELPADALRVLQRTALRHVHPRHVLEADDADRRLGRSRLRNCGGDRRRHRQRGRARLAQPGLDRHQRPGCVVRRGRGGLRRRRRAQHRGLGRHQAQAGRGAARSGLLGDPTRGPRRSGRGRTPVVPAHPAARRCRAGAGHHPERDLLRSPSWHRTSTPQAPSTSATSSVA